MLRKVLERAVNARATEVEGAEAAEAGFTLIELMVVLLIIAILLAIAIPTFLGVTNSANDRAAQSNLTNALTEASASFQNNSASYTGVSAYGNSNAPEYNWLSAYGTVNAANCGTAKGVTNCVSAEALDVSQAADQAAVILADYAKGTNTCWFVLSITATPGSPGTASSSGTNTFTSSGVATAGTYYSKMAQSDALNCYAAQAVATTWTWGSSFSNAPDK